MPDSHSSERIETGVLLEGLLAGIPYALHAPVTAAAMASSPVIGRMMYSEPGQALARALISGGQNWRQPAGEAIRRFAPQGLNAPAQALAGALVNNKYLQ